MAQQFNFELPKLSASPSYADITKILQSIQGLPRLTDTVLPEIQGLYGEGGPILRPQLDALGDSTAQALARMKSSAMKRGITGSSIEMGGLGQVEQSGLQAEAGLRGNVAQALSQLLFSAMQGDIQAATQLRVLLSQAMGEELGAQRDMTMFNKQLEELGHQAGANRLSARQAETTKMLMDLGKMGAAAGAGALFFSDRRLKRSVKKIGTAAGLDIVRFKWSERAKDVGLTPGRSGAGVIAQQVRERYPRAVLKGPQAYLLVNYAQLPAAVVSAVAAAGR